MVQTRRASSLELVEDGIARVVDFANVVAEDELQAILETEEEMIMEEIERFEVSLIISHLNCSELF